MLAFFMFALRESNLVLLNFSNIFPIAKNLEHWNNLYNQQLSLEHCWNNFTYNWNKLGTKHGTTYHLFISYTIQLGTSLTRQYFT